MLVIFKSFVGNKREGKKKPLKLENVQKLFPFYNFSPHLNSIL